MLSPVFLVCIAVALHLSGQICFYFGLLTYIIILIFTSVDSFPDSQDDIAVDKDLNGVDVDLDALDEDVETIQVKV